MKTITIQQFCVHYDVPHSFVEALSDYELIEIVEVDTSKHIQLTDINRLEQLMRMHYDLEVNMEGLDIISNLLTQIEGLQNEVKSLQNRLEFYD